MWTKEACALFSTTERRLSDELSYKPPNPVGENAPVGVKYELGVIGHDRETKCGV